MRSLLKLCTVGYRRPRSHQPEKTELWMRSWRANPSKASRPLYNYHGFRSMANSGGQLRPNPGNSDRLKPLPLSLSRSLSPEHLLYSPLLSPDSVRAGPTPLCHRHYPGRSISASAQIRDGPSPSRPTPGRSASSPFRLRPAPSSLQLLKSWLLAPYPSCSSEENS
jgi:hypothetical protein